jgi:hypothetical protein
MRAGGLFGPAPHRTPCAEREGRDHFETDLTGPKFVESDERDIRSTYNEFERFVSNASSYATQMPGTATF